jgi:hypothetical protein
MGYRLITRSKIEVIISFTSFSNLLDYMTHYKIEGAMDVPFCAMCFHSVWYRLDSNIDLV